MCLDNISIQFYQGSKEVKLLTVGLESYHENGVKDHHPEELMKPSCTLKAGCIDFGAGIYKCCGARAGETGCETLHACCEVISTQN